jgi:hypothetical protein
MLFHFVNVIKVTSWFLSALHFLIISVHYARLVHGKEYKLCNMEVSPVSSLQRLIEIQVFSYPSRS